jgi:GNAT superfamily N-acetyltransferase
MKAFQVQALQANQAAAGNLYLEFLRESSMSINHLFPYQQYEREGFLISTDPALLDLDVIHNFLTNESYWSPGIERKKIERYIQYCLCFGVYTIKGTEIKAATTPIGGDFQYHQIGFARVVSDFTMFAYLADVFILPAHRGQGLGKWLVESVLAHPELQNLRTWTLYTEDAHDLYRQFGFVPEPRPDKHMVFRPIRSIHQ